MSTRKLILTALVCGMAILIAGGVFLVNLSRHKDDLTVKDVYAVGQTVTVGGIAATVQHWQRDPDGIVATVHLDAGPGVSAQDASAPWSLVIGHRIDRRPVPDDCAGRTVAAGSALTCALGFAPQAGTPYLAFALAGHQVQWRLDGPG